MTPGLAVMNKNDYAQFKRDLIALGQVCQLFRQEFRCQQRNSMTPFVRIEESDAFSRIFYHPSLLNSNETMADFEGRPLTIIFPIGNDDPNDNSPRRRHDVLPLLKFMRDATQIQTRLWAHQVGQPLNDLFGSGGTFPTYLGTPDALRLRKVEYRPRAQHVPTIPGIFDEPYIGVFFETTNTADSVKWVNGWKWTWVDLTASRVTRSSQQLIPHPQKYQRWDFLNATGLNVAEIENSNWRVEFQVGEDKTSRTARKL